MKKISAIRIPDKIGVISRVMADMQHGARLFIKVIRKPVILLISLLSARAAQIVLVASLLLVPFALKPLSGILLEVIFPPEQKEHLFGLIKTSRDNPHIETYKTTANILLWVTATGLVIIFFLSKVPTVVKECEERSLKAQRDAEERGQGDPEASIHLYRSALGLTLNDERSRTLSDSIRTLEKSLSGRQAPSHAATPPPRQGEATVMLNPEEGQASTFRSRYRISKNIGSGAMGVVYLAHDEVLDRDVAIKELPQAMVSDGSALGRFRHEAKALAKLAHPGIVQVYDFVEEEGHAWIVMELVTGGDLEEMLRSKGSLDLQEVMQYGSMLADALAYAHAQGIVHRDFKASNVLISKEGMPKIADFGLAKVAQSNQHTVAGAILGSPSYMSPEQAEGKVADARSDIYSLGILLYRMLAGKVPFEGEDLSSVLMQHITKKPPALSRRVKGLPAEVGKLVMSMLEKDPDKRPENASMVSEVLRRHMR